MKYVMGVLVLVVLALAVIGVQAGQEQKTYLPVMKGGPIDAYQIDERSCGVQFEKHWVCYEPYPGKDAETVLFHQKVWDREQVKEHLLNSEVESLWAEWDGLIVETCYGSAMTNCTAQMYTLR